MKYTPMEPEPPGETWAARRARLARHHILNAPPDYKPTAEHLALSGLPSNYRKAAAEHDDFFD